MGNIFSRFKSLNSTKEKLESIQNEIEELEDYKWKTLRNQNHIIGLNIFVLSIVYAIMILVFYFYYMQRLKNRGLIAFCLYIFTFPIIAYFLRKLLKSYYQHKLSTKEDRLKDLKKQKRKILDSIMETETYKVAKEIIEKYDPAMLKDKMSPNQSILLNETAKLNDSILRQRISPLNQSTFDNTQLINRQRMMINQTPFQQPIRPIQQKAIMDSSSVSNIGLTPKPQFNPMSVQKLPPPQFVMPMQRKPNLIRPICPQDRSIVEKFVDYLVGDGPNNRYGLICKFCHSHNGMAHKDEFDYLNFRCCFCNNFNPARKQKPLAPTFISYENAFEKQSKDQADETLNDNLKNFKIDDDETSSRNNSTTAISEPHIEEIEEKLNETKLENHDDDIEKIDETDNEMQIDNTISNENTQQELIDEKSKEQLNKQLDDLKLTDANEEKINDESRN